MLFLSDYNNFTISDYVNLTLSFDSLSKITGQINSIIRNVDTASILLFFEVSLAIFLLAFSIGLIDFDFGKLLLRLFGKASPEDEQLVILGGEIAQIREVMGTLSPMNDFAKYFKYERTLKRLNDEKNSLAKIRSKSSFIRSFKLYVIVRVLVAVVSLFLAIHSSNLVLFYIDKGLFFPLNFFIQFPTFFKLAPERSIFSIKGDPTKDVPVSLYSVVFLALFLLKAYDIRSKGQKLKKM